MLERAHQARRTARYDDLVIAGVQLRRLRRRTPSDKPQHPKLRIHIAHIRPDVNPGMAGLLKEQPGSQLFTVFGQPRTLLKGPDGRGEYTVVMEGVDIYDPVNNTIRSTEDQQGRRVVPRRRLRRPDVLHHAGVLPGQVGVGEAEQGTGRRGRSRALRGALRHVVLAVPAGQAQVRRGEGDRPARQRSDAGPSAGVRRHGRADSRKHPDPAGRQADPLLALRGAERPLDLRHEDRRRRPEPGPPAGELLVQDRDDRSAQQDAVRRGRAGRPAAGQPAAGRRAPLAGGRTTGVHRNVTKELLRWWANPKRGRRLFFCQREAVETIIYLAELRIPGKSSRTGFKNFALSDDNLAQLLRGEKPRRASTCATRRLLPDAGRPAADAGLIALAAARLQDGDRQRQDGRHGDAHLLGVLQPGREPAEPASSPTPSWSAART